MLPPSTSSHFGDDAQRESVEACCESTPTPESNRTKDGARGYKQEWDLSNVAAGRVDEPASPRSCRCLRLFPTLSMDTALLATAIGTPFVVAAAALVVSKRPTSSQD
jgi:hypothetical protein